MGKCPGAAISPPSERSIVGWPLFYSLSPHLVRRSKIFIFLFEGILICLLFCPARADLSSLPLKEGQRFNLKTQIYLPTKFKKERYLRLENIDIPEFGLRLTDVEVSFLKGGGFLIKVASGEIDPQKLIQFLLNQSYLQKELPFSIKGPLKIEEATLKINKNIYHLEIKKIDLKEIGTLKNLLVKDLDLDVSSEDTYCRASILAISRNIVNNLKIKSFQKEGLVTIDFDNSTLETEEIQKFIEAFVPSLLQGYQKKFIPWVNLEGPYLQGKIFIKPKEIVLNIKKNPLFNKLNLEIKTKNISIISKNEEVLNVGFQGNIVTKNNNFYITLTSLDGNIIKMQTNFSNIKAKIYNLYFKLKKTSISLTKNINLLTDAEIVKGNVILDTDFIKDTFFFSNPAHIKMSLNGTNIEISDIDLSLKTKSLGSIYVKGNFYWPFDYKKERIFLNVKDLRLKPLTIINLALNKPINDKLKMAFQMRTNQGEIKLNGGFLDYAPDQLIFQARSLSFLPKKELSKITPKKETISASETKSSLEKPFDFSFLTYIKKVSPQWRILFDNVIYGDYPELERFSLLLDLSKNPTFSITTDVCYTNVSISGEIDPSGSLLDIEGDLSGISLPVDHFLACFLREAPVYILGRLTYKMSFDTTGKSPKELLERFSFDLGAEVQDGKILKVSNLNEHLRWLLKALSLVKLNPSKLHDTIVFDSLESSVAGNFSMLNVRRVFLSSPLLKMNLIVNGTVRLKPKIMKDLEGTISVMGLTKHFEVKDVKNDED